MIRIDTRKRGGLMLSELTPAELETLSLAAEGYSNPGIAEIRCVKKQTIENQMGAIYLKLGLPTSPARNARVEAMLMYQREKECSI